MEIRRVCEWCGKEFTAQTVKTQYCSKLCNNRAYKHRKRQECIELTICNSRKKLEEIRENQIPDIMTAGLAAMYIGVHISTIYRYMQLGILKCVQLPGKTLVRKSDIDTIFDNSPEYRPRDRITSDSPQGYTTVRLCSEKYKMPFPTVYKYLKENNVPFKIVRNKHYYSRTDAERVLDRKLAQEHPEITEWYTLKEIMDKYGMTESAVLTFIYEHGIPRKRKKGGLYSKSHVDEIKRRKMDPNDEYYSVQDCMRKYNLTRDQVYHFLRYYKIERIQSGRCVRFRKEDFDRHCSDPDGSIL